jgi:hypothetical protein
VRFPAPYKFQVVGKGEGTFVADMIACIGAAVGREIWEREVEVKERKGTLCLPPPSRPPRCLSPLRCMLWYPALGYAHRFRGREGGRGALNSCLRVG